MCREAECSENAIRGCLCSPQPSVTISPHSSNAQELLASRLTEALSEGEVERSLTSLVGVCPAL